MKHYYLATIPCFEIHGRHLECVRTEKDSDACEILRIKATRGRPAWREWIDAPERGEERKRVRDEERERERERRHVSAYAPSQTKKRERSIEADTRKIHRYRHTKRGFTSPLTTTVYPKWTRLCRQNCTYFPRMSMTLPHAVNARNALGVMITIQCALYAH